MKRLNSRLIVFTAGCGIVFGCSDNKESFSNQNHASWANVDQVNVQSAKPAPEIPIEPGTYMAAGRLHEMQGALQQALEQYQLALAGDPKNVGAMNRLAMVYSRLGRFDEAVRSLERAVELEPAAPLLRNNLGYAHLCKRNWSAAETQLREALKLNPALKRARVNLALSVARQERLDEALAEFRIVLPEPDALYNLGLVLRGMQHYREAADAFELVLERDPQFVAAQQQLEKLEPRLSFESRRAEREAVAQREAEKWETLTGSGNQPAAEIDTAIVVERFETQLSPPAEEPETEVDGETVAIDDRGVVGDIDPVDEIDAVKTEAIALADAHDEDALDEFASLMPEEPADDVEDAPAMEPVVQEPTEEAEPVIADTANDKSKPVTTRSQDNDVAEPIVAAGPAPTETHRTETAIKVADAPVEQNPREVAQADGVEATEKNEAPVEIAQVKPATSEPVEVEAAQAPTTVVASAPAESAQVEQVQVESAQTEPASPESEQTEPAPVVADAALPEICPTGNATPDVAPLIQALVDDALLAAADGLLINIDANAVRPSVVRHAELPAASLIIDESDGVREFHTEALTGSASDNEAAKGSEPLSEVADVNINTGTAVVVVDKSAEQIKLAAARVGDGHDSMAIDEQAEADEDADEFAPEDELPWEVPPAIATIHPALRRASDLLPIQETEMFAYYVGEVDPHNP